MTSLEKLRKKLKLKKLKKSVQMLGTNFLQEALYCCRLPYGRGRRRRRSRPYQLASDGGGCGVAREPNSTTEEESTPPVSNFEDDDDRFTQITKK